MCFPNHRHREKATIMKFLRPFLPIILLVAVATGCAGLTGQARIESPKGVRPEKTVYGLASWYGRDYHGRRTASGERSNMYEYTASHRALPFGTLVRVINLRNGRQVLVRINDRGPFIRGRVIDLSYVAARDLAMVETGVEKVRLEIFPG